MTRRAGFSQLELALFMAVLALGGALVVLRLPIYLQDKVDRETKGYLGAVRSALAIYYGDNEGIYPADLGSLTVAGKYLMRIPELDLQVLHPKSDRVHTGPQAPLDLGHWGYDNSLGTANWGTLWIACTHTDTRGSAWSSY